MREAGGRCHFHAVALSLGLRLGALLVGRLVVAVPGEGLAPVLSVVVYFLHEEYVLAIFFVHERLLEVPRVLHLDLIHDGVRIVN